MRKITAQKLDVNEVSDKKMTVSLSIQIIITYL